MYTVHSFISGNTYSSSELDNYIRFSLALHLQSKIILVMWRTFFI